MANISSRQWKEDLDQMAAELPQKHKNLFFQLARPDFERQIQELAGHLDEYDTYMIAVKIARIVSSAGDAHTSLILPASGYIPFVFYWFEEGIFIVAASDRDREFLYARVTHINEMLIEEVISIVGEIISHENESFLKSQLPKYLSSAAVLYGLEIIDEPDRARLTVEKTDGRIACAAVDTCGFKEFQDLSTVRAGSAEPDVPLYRQNRDLCFWSYYFEAEKTMYFNYSSCRDRMDITLSDFCRNLMDFVCGNDIRKVIIDLRNNLGGNSDLLEPFINELASNDTLNTRGGIFVIIGRDTFSSALLNAYALKNRTAALFVGEATGGKPNCYGEVEYFVLKNSGLKIRYATVYYEVTQDDRQLSLYPEIVCKVTFADYLGSRDPCVECALTFDEEK